MEGEKNSAHKKICYAHAVFMPEELVFHILLHLPVASLLRFKSVCRTWCHLIESSTFIDGHLQHHQNQGNSNNLILVPDSSGTCAEPYLVSVDTFEQPPSKLGSYLGCFHEIDFDYHIIDMAICNGIVCLHVTLNDRKLSVSLWNPATKKLRTLEDSPFLHPQVNPRGVVSIGFGYDTESNAYKVLRISNYPGKPQVKQVEVCSANTDSWRIVDSVLPCDVIMSNPRVPYRNGTYCWIGTTFCRDSENITKIKNTCIVSFDFSNEEFGTMSLPDVESVKSDPFPTLAIARDKIVCINRAKRNLEIWTLNEYGVQDSWTKLYTIRRDSFQRTLGLSENGAFLFSVNKSDQLCMYNLLTQEQNYCPAGEPGPSRWHRRRAAQYKESLVQGDR